MASSWDKAPSQSDEFFLNELKLATAIFSNTYKNFLLIGHFDMTPENKKHDKQIETSCLGNLINKPTNFKSSSLSCIVLILSNKKNHFASNREPKKDACLI